MASSYISSASTVAASGSSSVAATIPAGIVGDTLIAFCWAANATSTFSATGWSPGTAANGAQYLTRVADGTEGATVTFNRTLNTTGIMGITIERRRGAGAVSVTSTVNQTSTLATSVVIPAVTTPAANCDVITTAVKLNTSGTGWTPPGGVTERADFASSGSQGSRVAIGDEVVAAAGSTGTRTWTRAAGDTGAGKGGMIALLPLAPNQGTAAGSFTFTGTAVGSRPAKGTAGGSFTFTGGSAAGIREPKGSGAGTYAFTGTADGARAPKASAAGTFTWTGAAAGEAPATEPPGEGAAAGTFGWSGSAVGSRPAKATAGGTATWTGAAVGARPAKGSAAGDWMYSGAAAGYRQPRATAAGTFTWPGTAAGRRSPIAVTAGAFTWTGTATGVARAPRDVELTAALLPARYAAVLVSEPRYSARVTQPPAAALAEPVYAATLAAPRYAARIEE